MDGTHAPSFSLDPYAKCGREVRLKVGVGIAGKGVLNQALGCGRTARRERRVRRRGALKMEREHERFRRAIGCEASRRAEGRADVREKSRRRQQLRESKRGSEREGEVGTASPALCGSPAFPFDWG